MGSSGFVVEELCSLCEWVSFLSGDIPGGTRGFLRGVVSYRSEYEIKKWLISEHCQLDDSIGSGE